MSYNKRNPQDQHKKLFVGGLNINTTTEGLREFFEQFGTVNDAIVMRDPNTQKSRCFGFVTFDTVESVDMAQAGRPHNIDGKQVDSKRALPKEDSAPETKVSCLKVFVGGLRRTITQEQMQEYFAQYGTITDCQLALDRATGQSRGFGFVTYDDPDAVDKVIIARPHNIGDSKADVKKALSKEEMANVKHKDFSGGAPSGGGGWNNKPNWGNQGGYGQQPPQSQSWGGQGGQGYYGGGGYGGGMDASGGWGAPPSQAAPVQGYQQQGYNNWGADPSQNGGYDQQAYGGGQAGGPMRTGGYGVSASPYGRR